MHGKRSTHLVGVTNRSDALGARGQALPLMPSLVRSFSMGRAEV